MELNARVRALNYPGPKRPFSKPASATTATSATSTSLSPRRRLTVSTWPSASRSSPVRMRAFAISHLLRRSDRARCHRAASEGSTPMSPVCTSTASMTTTSGATSVMRHPVRLRQVPSISTTCAICGAPTSAARSMWSNVHLPQDRAERLCGRGGHIHRRTSPCPARSCDRGCGLRRPGDGVAAGAVETRTGQPAVRRLYVEGDDRPSGAKLWVVTQPAPPPRGADWRPGRNARPGSCSRADLSGQISLPRSWPAPADCRGVHFSQAFKQTVGCPPHQWAAPSSASSVPRS